MQNKRKHKKDTAIKSHELRHQMSDNQEMLVLVFNYLIFQCFKCTLVITLIFMSLDTFYYFLRNKLKTLASDLGRGNGRFQLIGRTGGLNYFSSISRNLAKTHFAAD